MRGCTTSRRAPSSWRCDAAARRGTSTSSRTSPRRSPIASSRELFGVPGPAFLTELAVALPFAKQHIGELHPDWLAALGGTAPRDRGFTTMQVWSIVLFADIVGNYQHQPELMALSLQAGSEFLTHLGTSVRHRCAAPSHPTGAPDAAAGPSVAQVHAVVRSGHLPRTNTWATFACS